MRIVIVLSGGLVQDIRTDLPDCTCAVVDLDIDDLEPDRITKLPSGTDCHLRFEKASYAPGEVEQVFCSEELPSVPPELVLDMAAALAKVVASHDNWRACSDMRESLNVWSETVDEARIVLDRLSRTTPTKEGTDDE